MISDLLLLLLPLSAYRITTSLPCTHVFLLLCICKWDWYGKSSIKTITTSEWHLIIQNYPGQKHNTNTHIPVSVKKNQGFHTGSPCFCIHSYKTVIHVHILTCRERRIARDLPFTQWRWRWGLHWYIKASHFYITAFHIC